MYKLDLHTHSVASPDGGLSSADYRRMLESGSLDFIAVTDHDRVDFAQKLQAELGDCIIVGEEITTNAGEIIGLYLKTTVPGGLPPLETTQQIHAQGGLVYVPHPFETVRKGLSLASLDAIATEVDIVETFNGRTFQNGGHKAARWAADHHIPGAASSDAHGQAGWGRTYAAISEKPTRENLAITLNSAKSSHQGVGLRGRLYPKLNRLQRRLRG
ncbi:MAG TPA: PHP domain-containing protein [Candidatus Saccharimonadales bacterium]|nr:PHP domain-containing protein [Candidatus Saccharimonadales bacterium]